MQWFTAIDEDSDPWHKVCTQFWQGHYRSRMSLCKTDGIGIEDPVRYAEEQGYQRIFSWRLRLGETGSLTSWMP